MCEREEIAGIARGKIDAAVRATAAKVVMPEGRVEAVRAFEELHPRNVLDGVVLVDVGALEVVHVGVVELDPDLKDAPGGFRLLCVPAGGHQSCERGRGTLVGDEKLLLDIDVDPAVCGTNAVRWRHELGPRKGGALHPASGTKAHPAALFALDVYERVSV